MKKRIAVIAAVIAGLYFMGSRHLNPAFAGHWEEVPFDYQGQYPPPPEELSEYQEEAQQYLQGTSTYSGSSLYSLNGDWSDPNWQFAGHEPFMIDLWLIDTSIQLSSIGKVRTKFRWIPDQINGVPDPNDPPPANLNLQVEASARADASNGSGNDLSVTASVDDESANEESIPPTYIYKVAQKTKYIPISISTDGASEVWVPWINLSASAESSNDGPNSDVLTSVTLGYHAEVDNRAVQISSSADPTYYKDENGERQPNQHNANGSMTVDVAATWNNTLNMWYWNGAFSANLSGSLWDSPTYTWAGSLLDGKPNPGNVLSIGNDQYILDSYTEEAGPGAPLNLAISAEDTDGRYLVGTYKINFHKPHENEIAGPVSYTAAEDVPYQPFSTMLDPVSVADRGLLEYGQDLDKKDMKWADGLSLGSATLGVNGAILAVIPGTQPLGVALGAISVVMGGTATVVSSLPAAPARYVPLNITSYAKYKEAIRNANDFITYPSGVKYYATDRKGANRTQFFANLIATSESISDENGIGDPYYSTYTDVKGKAYFNPTKRTWTYDEYGPNGFVGQKSVVAYRNGENPAVEITWIENP